MKEYSVYEIINLMGSVEYVGQTCNLKRRWGQHKCNSTSPGQGKFFGRSDVIMNVVQSGLTKEESLDLEEKLQLEYKLPTDVEKLKNKLNKPLIPTKIFKYETNEFVGEWESLNAASRSLNLRQGHLWCTAVGQRKQTKGYYARYV